MIRHLPLIAALIGTVAADDAPADLLRLTNGELEGRFGGINRDGVLRWDRDDGIAPMEFRTDKVRQIVLRGGSSLKPGKDTSHLLLLNGDRLPAKVVSLDDETITLDTEVAGSMVVPRDAIKSLAPNPFGGKLLYAGPFQADEWKITGLEEDEEKPDEEAKEDDAEKPEEKPEKPAAEKKDPGWRHVGSKWYHTSGSNALLLDPSLPDRSVFRFHLEWRSRPPISIAFHADFKEPKVEEDVDVKGNRQVVRHSSSSFVDSFGNALVLTLRSSYAQLYRCGYDADGEAFNDQVRSSSTTVRVDDSGEADFELRTDRTKGTVSLFVNGEYSLQWQLDPVDPDNPDNNSIPAGGGIGFQILDDDSPVRISDVIVAEWNGMPDSARSLESDDFDVVLLTNGTDRFSGKVRSIRDGSLTLEGQYAELTIPMEEIAEVHFARSALRETEESADREIRVHFQPLGRLSGIPGVTAGGSMKLRSPLIGELAVDLDSAVILEFQSGNRFLNYWDEDL
ncbi:hypothetical protein HAHE_36380 [Haloferula helveola]|uniref:Uncharacterized protein n=1 Tax=Haloferula helveola TaxID=490095 RepID=A0ABN6HFF8_9BACT|nr:hypothetical protein HAHE_36380 [Haloferula helveola]